MFGSYLVPGSVGNEIAGLKTPTRPAIPGSSLTPSTPSSSFSPRNVPSNSSPFSSRDSPSSLYPWNWTANSENKILDLASPQRNSSSSTTGSSSLDIFSTPLRHKNPIPVATLATTPNTNNQNDAGKRGRPRADVISHLILEGSNSPNGIKCRVCSRVFPREKSLQAHLRTHTGERPYNCDYPGCSRAFTQSGQLKTHQRLHAGEKPFICSSIGCNNRYTHANRTCPVHPYSKPTRSTDLVLQPVLSNTDNNDAVMIWLENYRRDRQEKTPGKSIKLESTSVNNVNSPQLERPLHTSKSKRGLEMDLMENNENLIYRQNLSKLIIKREIIDDDEEEGENSLVIDERRSILEERLNSPRKTLGDITTMRRNSPIKKSPLNSPVSTSFKLKKRWLKEVFQDEEQKKKKHNDDENLALPIRWTDEEQRRSPKSLVVANALVELAKSAKFNENQPLNLSLNNS